MPRLFAAIELPESVHRQVVGVLPPLEDGVRPVEPEHLHLTLHFFGELEVAACVRALAAVSCPAPILNVRGVGSFGTADASTTLWAGVDSGEDLSVLHRAVGSAVFSLGYRPETRPYSPHISLARCSAVARPGFVDAFLQRHSGFAVPPAPVRSFALYSSRFVGGVPQYQREATFELPPQRG